MKTKYSHDHERHSGIPLKRPTCLQVTVTRLCQPGRQPICTIYMHYAIQTNIIYNLERQ